MNNIEQDTEIHDLWVYIREWNDKFGRLPKDEDELAACVDYVMKRQKPVWSEYNRWRPSKEQMQALNAINTIGEISYVGQGDLLIELYNELKKL